MLTTQTTYLLSCQLAPSSAPGPGSQVILWGGHPTASFKIANGHPSPSLYADLLFFIAVTTNGQTGCTGFLLSPFRGEPRTSVTSCLMHYVCIHTHTYTRVYTQMLRVHVSVFSYILSTCHIIGSQRLGINRSYVHIDYKISLNFRNVKMVGKKMYSS